DARRLDPVRALLGRALLPDHLTADALRLALELARPLEERANNPVADADEVPHEVELRLAPGGKVDLVGVRDLHGAVANLDLDERRRHYGEYRECVLEDPRPIRLSLEPLGDFLVVWTPDVAAGTRDGLDVDDSAGRAG